MAGCRWSAAARIRRRPAEDPNYNYTQVIILLTDGLNTQDRWYTSQSLDRRAPADDLQQHQGRRHHALHDPGEHRRRSDLARCCRTAPARRQVLPAHVGEPDRHRPSTRSAPTSRNCASRSRRYTQLASSRRSVTREARRSAGRRLQTEKPGQTAGLIRVVAWTRRRITSRARPSRSCLRAACRSPWRGRCRARPSWSPRRRSPHRRS